MRKLGFKNGAKKEKWNAKELTVIIWVFCLLDFQMGQKDWEPLQGDGGDDEEGSGEARLGLSLGLIHRDRSSSQGLES